MALAGQGRGDQSAVVVRRAWLTVPLLLLKLVEDPLGRCFQLNVARPALWCPVVTFAADMKRADADDVSPDAL
jgi:hypothetical protein